MTPWTVAPPSSSVHGILQARILEWVAVSFSRGSSSSRDQTHVSCIPWEVSAVFVPLSWLTLCGPWTAAPRLLRACSSPGGLPDPIYDRLEHSNPGILALRTLCVFTAEGKGSIPGREQRPKKMCSQNEKEGTHFFPPEKVFSPVFAFPLSTWEGTMLPFRM